jgi:AcrR family transcriptional regulator
LSPRPAASRTDATAEKYLSTAADLIDAYLQAEPFTIEQAARLRAIKFPAALEWIRIDDVVRLLRETSSPKASKQALWDRWKTKDEFIAAVIAYALIREQPNFVTERHADEIAHISADSASGQFIRVADGVLDSLLPYPRTYLLLHIAPLLPQHPQIHEAVMPTVRQGINNFSVGYDAMLTHLGLVPRPEWTIERISLALQAMLDGFCLRPRIMPEEYSSRWKGASLFADTVIAFTLGIIDWDKTGEEGRAALDRLVGG